jgi:hypothetical protein
VEEIQEGLRLCCSNNAAIGKRDRQGEICSPRRQVHFFKQSKALRRSG